MIQINFALQASELSATKEALSKVDLKGKLVAGDALQTQREICKSIVEKGGTIFSP